MEMQKKKKKKKKSPKNKQKTLSIVTEINLIERNVQLIPKTKLNHYVTWYL